MKSDKLQNLKGDLKSRSINLKTFLLCYYGISNESIQIEKISHKDAKVLMPFLKSICFDDVIKNKEQIYLGLLVPVRDSYNNVIVYMNPKLENIDYIEESLPQSSKEAKYEEILISEDLQCFELALLCKKLKQACRYKEYNIAYRLLKCKRNCKKLKMKKYIAKKEREKYEKY